ncbi:MAG TPA: hypothetical protein VEH50_11270 [Methylomirabilota bacterium]|nr:hypothetical protein [Methylomirabilota bacterium]
MAISKYTLYKYVKVDGAWRYCKAAYHDKVKIKTDIVFVNVKEGLVEKHPEGRYYMSHNGQWIVREIWHNYPNAGLRGGEADRISAGAGGVDRDETGKRKLR